MRTFACPTVHYEYNITRIHSSVRMGLNAPACNRCLNIHTYTMLAMCRKLYSGCALSLTRGSLCTFQRVHAPLSFTFVEMSASVITGKHDRSSVIIQPYTHCLIVQRAYRRWAAAGWYRFCCVVEQRELTFQVLASTTKPHGCGGFAGTYTCVFMRAA